MLKCALGNGHVKTSKWLLEMGACRHPLAVRALLMDKDKDLVVESKWMLVSPHDRAIEVDPDLLTKTKSPSAIRSKWAWLNDTATEAATEVKFCEKCGMDTRVNAAATRHEPANVKVRIKQKLCANSGAFAVTAWICVVCASLVLLSRLSRKN